VIVIIVCLFTAGLSFYFRFRRKKTTGVSADRVAEAVEAYAEEEAVVKDIEALPVYPSINMLGEFSIFNAANENLTQQFTPTTKQLFLLLILYTFNKKGVISSQEIQNALWENKDHESARNNRNVYLNKLRLLLISMKEVSIQNKKGQWYIRFNSNVYIDYEDVKSSIRTFSQSTPVNKNELKSLLGKIKKGKLLPFFEFEWLDDYKTAYSDMVVDFLYKMSEHPEIKNDYYLLTAIADAIMIQDNIDEKGVKIKCNALIKLGKQNQAVQVFKKYCEDYKKLLGEKPDVSFDTII